jgi:cytoskeleton protein RodZ
MARGNFGERLKREREMREVTLAEITAATRIGSRFLEALENEDWQKLPGGVFNRGFVRAVAHYLGLHEEDFLAEYDLARADHAKNSAPPVENRIPPPPKWLPALAIAVVLLVIASLVAAGVYGWRYFAARHAAKKSAAVAQQVQPQQPTLPNTTPAVLVPPAAASLPPAAAIRAAPAPLDLSISTSVATRMRILADDKLVLDAEVNPGESLHFAASRQFEVSAADSSAVLLELNGKAMPPLGAPGASGRILLSEKDLRQASDGNSQP